VAHVPDSAGPDADHPRPAFSLVCPELVGREAESDWLRARVEGAAHGRGGVLVLVGAAGAGKSRLAREVIWAATARGAAVLFGRAVPGANTVPHRPLAEALLAAHRSGPPPEAPELVGFTGHLARLLPHWPQVGLAGSRAETSPVLLHEGIVRLLALSGRGRGAVLVLEDLHWADAETIEAVDYFADALADEPVLCVCTCRPGGTAAAELSERLLRRDLASVLAVPSLSDHEVYRMVGACLRGAKVSGQLVDFVRVHSDGNPFLVEELLAGLVASGQLRVVDGYWTGAGALTPTVPASLGESIRQRLTGLDLTARRVVGAAALLGRRFEWELLPGIAEVDGREVVDGLRRAVDIQLVEVEGDGFRFRHALTREAVLADLLPPDRAQLAGRAWPALERAHPGLPGGFCELAAELAEAAGNPEAAANRLVESAGRACRDGALSTAEATARRAKMLAPDGGPAAAAADEVMVAILVAAGKTEQALAIGRYLAARFDAARVRPERRTDLLVQLAHAALTAGDTGTAAGYTAAARAVVDELPDEMSVAPTARIDAAAAHVALERGRSDEASALAHAAVAAAAAADQPEVECEALQVLGRLGRQHSLDEAGAWLERAAEVAARHRLAGWHLRARHELALIAWGRGDPSQLQETRDLAAGYGALTTVAVMDLSLADVALSGFDQAGCLAAASNCAGASRRYGLATARLAHLWLAGAHALAGDDKAMQAALELALAPAPDDPRILGDLYGRVLPTRSFVADDLGALREQLDAMMPHVAAAPAGMSVFPGRLWWATLHTIEDDDHGAGPRAHYRGAAEALGMAVFVAAADVADAVAFGRVGNAEAATALMASARERLRRMPRMAGMAHCQQLLVARAAARDGWGEPAAWLRESEAFFAAGGYHRLARRCRTMLGALGAPVPRRGRGISEVPAALRGLGVTSREVDVLTLVAEGCTTREIAERLYLSTKTVERHLSNLADRTGRRGRAALRELAREHGLGVGNGQTG
jgi:DNA-binding CsgD family transcriptional regulator